MSGPIWSFLDNERIEKLHEQKPLPGERSSKGQGYAPMMGERHEKRHDPAPTLGQHNEYLLGEVLGYPNDRMQELAAKQIIGKVPLEGADMGGVRRVQREAR